ncbi:MAG TPA: cytochrome b/b6 domain-containing protein [Coriobacteriia bacterium]|jgi:Ni,Fe-hydrogenase I cytochrome b subunit
MDLLRLNVWLDVAFPLIWEATALFLAVHFLLAIITGRARKSFIEGKWPEHDSVPPPLPKFLHAQHMFMMVVLAITGMYIRFPWFANGRPLMRGLHYFAMIVVSVNLVWRLWYAFFSKQRDWKEFRIQKRDAVTLGGVLKYYGYMSNNKPHVAKYNVAQKGSYMLFLVMMAAQAFTGFALLNQRFLFGTSPRELLVGWWLGALVGSSELAGWWARTVHYILNWGFIIMTTVHVYLSATVDIPCTLDFFGLKRLEIKPGAHGHEAPVEPIAVQAASTE